MTGVGPGREHEQYPRVAAGTHLVALARVEHGEQARPAGHGVAVALRDLDLARDDDEVGALVHLVVLELLTGREVERDRAGLAAARVADLGLVPLDPQAGAAPRLDAEAGEVPVLHAAGKTTSPRPPSAAAPSTGGSGATRASGRPPRCRRSRTG